MSIKNDGMHGWRLAGIIALIVIVFSVPLYVAREKQPDAAEVPDAVVDSGFVGRDKCIDCHDEAYQAWLGSDHDLAMDIASDETVLGDFDDAEFEHNGITSRFYRDGERFLVYTEGTGGEMAEFEVRYTFGVEPLQQYLVPLPGGRLAGAVHRVGRRRAALVPSVSGRGNFGR